MIMTVDSHRYGSGKPFLLAYAILLEPRSSYLHKEPMVCRLSDHELAHSLMLPRLRRSVAARI